jgi:hypothetical protein
MVIMPKEKTKFTDCKSRLAMENILLASLPAADRAAVITNEVSKRNPVAMTRVSEKNRCRMVTVQKLCFLLSTFQIALRAS